MRWQRRVRSSRWRRRRKKHSMQRPPVPPCSSASSSNNSGAADQEGGSCSSNPSNLKIRSRNGVLNAQAAAPSSFRPSESSPCASQHTSCRKSENTLISLLISSRYLVYTRCGCGAAVLVADNHTLLRFIASPPLFSNILCRFFALRLATHHAGCRQRHCTRSEGAAFRNTSPPL